MDGYKIVITDYYYKDQEEENKAYARLGKSVEILDLTKIRKGGLFEPEEIIPYVKDCDALVVQFAKITKEVIQAMEHCKVIARYAIGVDNIDLEAAKEKSIYVSNVPDYCIDEVADTAIAHILNGMRGITKARDFLLKGSFQMCDMGTLPRVKDSVLGLLGFGNIARNVANKMQHFFKEIFVYDPFFGQQEKYPYVHFTGLEQILDMADAISLHIPLNPSTRNMIGEAELRRMKPCAVLVNTARGGLIDENALLKVLDEGHLGYCGLDVADTENFLTSPLLHHDRIALTPHIAWNSIAAVKELQRKVGENVVSTLTEGKPVYHV